MAVVFAECRRVKHSAQNIYKRIKRINFQDKRNYFFKKNCFAERRIKWHSAKNEFF